jgi:acetyl-CoA acyltransferase
MSEMATITGIGMTPFGRHQDSVADLAVKAAEEALADAAVSPADVDMVVFANSMQGLLDGQESLRGQVALQSLGLKPGTPIINVEAACASGSTAVGVAAREVSDGATILVTGAEKLYSESKSRTLRALATARDVSRNPDSEENPYLAYYAETLRERIAAGELTIEQVAAVSAKNSRHGAMNPLAQYRTARTVAEVLESPVVADPLTRYMCSPISDGAAALVLSPGGRGPRIRALATAGPGFESDRDLIAAAATKAYDQAGVGPDDLDLAEVHDATASAEIAAYEGLGLSAHGEGGDMAERGETALGGRTPVNPSGGLTSRGHPVGATGVAQLVELVLQLRGDAGDRQVEGAALALAENHGGLLGNAPAAITVTVLAR